MLCISDLQHIISSWSSLEKLGYAFDPIELEKHGFMVFIEPETAVAFGGRRIVFMMNIDFGLMEILETEG